MTSSIAFPAHVIGLMSGTSADGVDAALLFTDGKTIAEPKGSAFVPYEEPLRREIFACMQGRGDEKKTEHAITEIHHQAVVKLLENNPNVSRETIALIGFHGQTIWHRPDQHTTCQLGDGKLLARLTGIPVVDNFRSNDMLHSGQGAPLAPLYHAALATNLEKPVMVVNIGGVSNVTWIGENVEGAQLNILAFDSGPGNALLDDWMQEHFARAYDKGGEISASGIASEHAVQSYLKHAFFSMKPPKSLDRNDFSLKLVRHLSPEDAAATLAAVTAACIAHAARQCPTMPKKLLITGGGRHNPVIMKQLARYSGAEVLPVESVGWNGDMLEAEAFAYLAARSVQKLPLSLPSTTRVAQPVTGGVFYPV